MLIVSNSLSKKIDEGCLKIASSIVKRIKSNREDTYVVTYERESDLSDVHLNINKLLLNKHLFKIVKKHNGDTLYIPFPAKELATAIRVFILSRMCKKKLYVILTMRCKEGIIGRTLFKASGAHFIAFSNDAYQLYADMVGTDRVTYLKAGVDTERFVPVTKERKAELRQKYEIDPNKKVILHVGHLKEGRNIAQLKQLSDKYQVLLVVSSFDKEGQNLTLKEELLSNGNIRILDDYIYNIEEIYQLSDVYFFPTLAEKNCIDTPLSCLEAASCNLKIVTTDYGEMKALKHKEGFYFIDSFDSKKINYIVDEAIKEESVNTRQTVEDYDWSKSVSFFMNLR